ncbi:hypothetical protein ABW19_dt0207067 [Dactylella cylindrospora]|nr:hypothetical protein ABW19_dt0207067 [Dactylella cylindrospora]
MAETSKVRALKAAALKAHEAHALKESEKDIKHGGWKFRIGELVWAHVRSETELGGTWFAVVVIGVPDTASFSDFANVYRSREGGRGLYRVQKCGSDSVIWTVHTSDLLPWIKVPIDTQNITIDQASKVLGEHAATSCSVISWPPNPIVDYPDIGKQRIDLRGVFIGPEKIWLHDAVRLRRPGNPVPGVSIWDPQQYDLLVIRRIFIETTIDFEIDESGSPSKTMAVYLSGDVLTMHPAQGDNVTQDLPNPVPNYIKSIGTSSSYGKWFYRPTNGKVAVASLSRIFGRFYDPRIMSLMDSRWATVDSLVNVTRHTETRALDMGITVINGEPIRDVVPEPMESEPADSASFLRDSRRGTFTPEERAEMMERGDVMTDEQLREYRQRSGGLSLPRGGESSRDQDMDMGGTGKIGATQISSPPHKKRRAE